MECSCCASLTRIANKFLKALGAKKKDHTDIIPEALTPEHFDLHETFHHGFPSQPTCLAYDPVQQLLAIGTENGVVLLLGMPGLERRFSHPTEVPILQMLFVTNKGLLVTSCDNKTIYLWSLQGKTPCFQHKVVFRTEVPTAISWTYGSVWMYVGTDYSNVYILNTEKLTLSGCWIRWKNTADVYELEKPGDVMTVQEHPLDQSKVLIAYSRGMCALWDLKNKTTESRFSYNLSENHTLTSMCWLGNGKSFACSYSDGCVALWNPAKPGNKPEKTFFPHESDHDRATFKPVNKVQSVNTDSGPWHICSGGLPEDSPSSIHSLTIKQRKSSSHLSTTSPIMDFLCLPSSPFPYDCQKPFALVILTKNELIVHDLESSSFPTFNLPYALDVHLSPVTCLQYCSNCPEEFIASLQSVNSELIAENKSTKPWPLKGGKWGEEPYQMSTDLIVTGHADGSVRFWLSNSVIFQPILTVSTSRYFKMKHKTFAPQLDTLEEHSVLGMEEEQGVRYPSSHRERKRSRETPSPATGQPRVRPSPRGILRSLRKITTSTKPTTSTALPEDETASTVKSVSPVGSSLASEEFLAIQEINMYVHGSSMCVANVGGSVLTFDFKMGEVTTTPKSLEVCFNYDSVFYLKGQSTSVVTIPSGDWTLREGVKDSKPGFHLTQHCQCYYSSSSETESLPVIVSSMQYSSDIGMLAIGTDQGLSVVDTITNKCLYILSNLTSILYLTNQDVRRGSTPATFSPKPTVMKHASLRSMSTQQFRVTTPGTPVGKFVLPDADPRPDSPTFLEKVEECECSVTALEIVQLQMDKHAPPTLTLWVGLASGHIAAYIVSIKQPENVGFGHPQRILKIKVFPTPRFANKSPIVSIHFLNEQGGLHVAPYKALSDCRGRSSEASKFHNLHYAIISDEKRIQSFSFPGSIPVGKVTPPIQNNAILMSEYFTCHDLPCLLSLTSCQHILVHSLPYLEPLMHFFFPLLSDIRVLCTFGVSANGEVLYMSSASEIQRMSLVKNDSLNLPACLPDTYIHLKDPQPVNRKESRKCSMLNREHIFGKDAGSPRVSVIERESLASTPVKGRTSKPWEEYSKLKERAKEREVKIEATAKSTTKLAVDAKEFYDLMPKNKT